MDWQQIASLMIVGAVAGMFFWSRFAPRRRTFKGQTGCGCGAGGPSNPPPSVIIHSRKGERQQIVVRSN